MTEYEYHTEIRLNANPLTAQELERFHQDRWEEVSTEEAKSFPVSKAVVAGPTAQYIFKREKKDLG